MKKYRVFAMLLSLPLAGLFSSCGADTQTVQPEVIRPVVTMVAPDWADGRVRRFAGTAGASAETLLSFRVGGELMELPVKKGQALKTGDLIGKIDPKDNELQVQQSKAELAQSVAQLEQVKMDYERNRQLYETESVSKSTLDAMEASYKSGVAARDAARKRLELIEQQLQYCTLYAPTDGIVVNVPVEIHQTVSAGQTVAVMTSGAQMEMEIGVPETLINDVLLGLEGTVAFDALPGVIFKTTVTEVGVQTGDSSTYPVTLSLPQSGKDIRLGMVGEVNLVFKNSTDIRKIVLPQVAVVPEVGGGHFIWVYQPATETVAKRPVKIGQLTSEGLEIIDGLAPGEIVVKRGVHRVKEGMKVTLLQKK